MSISSGLLVERHSNFRTESPSQLIAPLGLSGMSSIRSGTGGGVGVGGGPAATNGPVTGLSMLMNGHLKPQLPDHLQHNHHLHQPQHQQHHQPQQDRHDEMDDRDDDRDRQASALAAAGMVAESVRISGNNARPAAHGLQPPPALATAHLPLQTSNDPVDNVDWSFMDMAASNNQIVLDDIDMDFAKLFDPAQEVANMQTEGSGWPMTTAAAVDSPSVPDAATSAPHGGNFD
jgi:hypothetical protein